MANICTTNYVVEGETVGETEILHLFVKPLTNYK